MNLRQKRQNVLFQQAWNTQRSGFHNAAKLFGSSKDDPGLVRISGAVSIPDLHDEDEVSTRYLSPGLVVGW